jgi:hypothetical protein
MSMSYVHLQFALAVKALATGTGRIQDRVYACCVSYLHKLKADDFPEKHDCRQHFVAFMDRLSYPDSLNPNEEARIRTQGSFRIICDRLTDTEASNIAQTICDFEALTLQYYIDERIAEIVKNTTAE